MRLPHFRSSYKKHVKNLKSKYDEERAMSLAVGGEFEAIGKLEKALLVQYGLEPTHTVIDVGCGSGRLAFQLKEYLTSRYIGLDVVEDLLRYAERICQRDDWEFKTASGLSIPEPSESAELVCFFSVFTHLLHEESYQYLEDAKRVLKPGGKIIFSFLEFRIPSHWMVFETAVRDTNPNKVSTQFLSRDAIEAWVDHLGLRIATIHDGDKPYIKLHEVIREESGEEVKGTLGQSVCVLTT